MSVETMPEASFEAALAAVVAAMPEQGQPEAVAAPVQLEPAAEVPVPSVPVVQPDAVVPAVDALAAREAAITAREQQASEIEARSRAAEAKLAELTSREQAISKSAEAFERDPVGYVRALRPDLTPSQAAAVAEKFYHVALGERAPAEVKLGQEVAEVRREHVTATEQLKAEIESMRQESAKVQQQAMLAKYQADLRAHAAALKADEYPILSGLASRNPERFTSELFQEAVAAARESHARGDAKVVELTPAEAAKRVEAKLKAQREELYGSPPAVAPAPEPQVQSITNRSASVQPSRTVPDTVDDKALRKAALEAAGLGHVRVWD